MKGALHRHAKRIVAASLVLTMGLGLAYQQGGHHKVVLAIFAMKDRPMIEARRIEALCSQLPDLSADLDAITQRYKVLDQLEENQWGLLGRCTGPITRHMVRTHFYLHALTGLDAARLQAAAPEVRQLLVDRLKSTTSEVERTALYCSLGFADHMMGDSHAHQILTKSANGEDCPGLTMYEPGTGHAFDGTRPDLLVSRAKGSCADSTWQHWMSFFEKNADGDAAVKEVEDFERINSTWLDAIREQWPEDAKESGLERGLTLSMAGSPYAKEVDIATESLTKWGFLQKFTCQQVAEKLLGRVPDKFCQLAWDEYLTAAAVAFPYEPTGTCSVNRDRALAYDHDPNRSDAVFEQLR